VLDPQYGGETADIDMKEEITSLSPYVLPATERTLKFHFDPLFSLTTFYLLNVRADCCR